MAASPPAPKSILRGHQVQVHTACFLRKNERLATGDADGFVVFWDLTIMRPRAVWRAHEGGILDIQGWGRNRIITHGRDHKLVVWKLGAAEEERLSTALPVEGDLERPQPWILHMLEVNTMNFCAFAICSVNNGKAVETADEVLIAVPNTLESEAIDIFQLPSQTRLHTVRPGKANGIAMCLGLTHLHGSLLLVSAFENGHASVHRLESDNSWTMTYRSQAHTQPVLSLDVHPSEEYFLTSGADSMIAKHPLPQSQKETESSFNPDDRIIEEVDQKPSNSPSSLLSAQMKSYTAQTIKSRPNLVKEAYTEPLKTIKTKHSGQQSLHIRSDGRIFATAGWDSRARVYSCKTLKELAVLSWHKVGCYAVAFAEVDVNLDATPSAGLTRVKEGGEQGEALTTVIARTEGNLSVKERRFHQTRATHWVAAGAKDGKVSLWDVY